MRIGLKQDKLDELISALYEVSDPAHERYASLFGLRKVTLLTVPLTSRYGAHLSKEEVEALVSPHPTSLSLVESWLADHGIDTSTAKHFGASSWLTIVIPVSQAERMLNTKYHTFFNALTSSYVVRTLDYSLPRELHEHIDVVSPTTYFGSINTMKKTSFLMPDVPPAIAGSKDEIQSGTVPSSCATTITPECLRSLYNSSTYVPKATANNSLGIVGYLEEYANDADLQVNGRSGRISFVSVLTTPNQTFFKQFRTDAVGATFQTVLVNGGLNDQSNPGVEVSVTLPFAIGWNPKLENYL
jgi:tripeptidyl-peptidase-1